VFREWKRSYSASPSIGTGGSRLRKLWCSITQGIRAEGVGAGHGNIEYLEDGIMI